MPELRTVTPLLPAGPSLTEGLRFYTEQLGFAITWQGGEMAGVRRGRVERLFARHFKRCFELPHWPDDLIAMLPLEDLARDGLGVEVSCTRTWALRALLSAPLGLY